MEKIITRDKFGNKVLVEYKQTVIQEPESKPIMTFDDTEDGYKRFKLCLRRSEEENQYAYGKGDKNYEKAIHTLVTENHDLYMKFMKRLRDDLRR